MRMDRHEKRQRAQHGGQRRRRAVMGDSQRRSRPSGHKGADQSPISIAEWKSQAGRSRQRSDAAGLGTGRSSTLSRREKEAMLLRAILLNEISDEQLDALVRLLGEPSPSGASGQVQRGSGDTWPEFR